MKIACARHLNPQTPDSFSHKHTFLTNHFPSSSFLPRRGRKSSLSVPVLRHNTQPSAFFTAAVVVSLTWTLSSHNSRKILEIRKLFSTSWFVYKARMEAKVEDGNGPQEMEEVLAVGQISSCPPTTLDTPRCPRLQRASRYSAEPWETSPCRREPARMYWRPSVLEMGIEDKRW